MTCRPPLPPKPARRAPFLLCLAAAVVMAGCGGRNGTSEATTSAAASPAAGTRTIGEIADRIAAAWPTVRTYRTTSTGSTRILPAGTRSGASPVASESVAFEVVDEVLLPDRKHRVKRVDGAVELEEIVVDGRIYARGVAVPGVTPPASGSAWLTIDPAQMDASSVYRKGYEDLRKPVNPPYSGLSPSERARAATDAGMTKISDRQCRRYRVADMTTTGDKVEVYLAIDDHDLPCSVETRAAGTVNLTVFAYNIPLAIDPPANATPAA